MNAPDYPCVWVDRRGERVNACARIPDEQATEVSWKLEQLGAEPRWDQEREVWRLNNTRASLKVMRALALGKGACWYVIYTKHGGAKFCTGSCLGANPELADLCECLCGGEFHGSGLGLVEIERTRDLVLVQHAECHEARRLVYGSSVR